MSDENEEKSDEKDDDIIETTGGAVRRAIMQSSEGQRLNAGQREHLARVMEAMRLIDALLVAAFNDPVEAHRLAIHFRLGIDIVHATPFAHVQVMTPEEVQETLMAMAQEQQRRNASIIMPNGHHRGGGHPGGGDQNGLIITP